MSDDTPTELLPVLRDDAPNIDDMPAANSVQIIAGYATQLETFRNVCETLTVTDANDRSGIELAQTTLKQVARLRIDLDKERKRLVDESLRRQQRINSLAKSVRDTCELWEERLKEQAEFAIRLQLRQREERTALREQQMRQISLDPAHYRIDDMSEEEFAEFLARETSKWEAFVQQSEANEKARVEREQQQALEHERARVENERLRQEAQQRDAEMARERQEMQAKLDAERRQAEADLNAERDRMEAQRRVEAEQARKQQEQADALIREERERREALERKEQAARALAEQAEAVRQQDIARAAQAPDREKLIVCASELACLKVPDMTSENGQKARFAIMEKLSAFSTWVEGLAQRL